MIIFKPYTNIKDFLQRFTILKIGNLHIRLHKITDKDRTTLFHNHPFNYISVILKGGYTETYLTNKGQQTASHGFLSIVKRNHHIYHRIDEIKKPTLTLFIAYGKYPWNAFNTENHSDSNGLYLRLINSKQIWSKRENGIWFIGHEDKDKAIKETRHSIHQIL